MANEQIIHFDLAQFPVEVLEEALRLAKGRKSERDFKEKTRKVGHELGRLELILSQAMSFDFNIKEVHRPSAISHTWFTKAMDLYTTLVADPNPSSAACQDANELYGCYERALEMMGGYFTGYTQGYPTSQLNDLFRKASDLASQFDYTQGAKNLDRFMDAQRRMIQIKREKVVSDHTREMFFASIIREIHNELETREAVNQAFADHPVGFMLSGTVMGFRFPFLR